MQIEITKNGLKVTHPLGVVNVYTLEDLQQIESGIIDEIDDISNQLSQARAWQTEIKSKKSGG